MRAECGVTVEAGRKRLASDIASSGRANGENESYADGKETQTEVHSTEQQ